MNHSTDWLQLILHAHDPQHIETLSETLEDSGALAIRYESADEEELFEPLPGEMPLWSNTRIIALFSPQTDLEPILYQLREKSTTELTVDHSYLPDEVWERAWLKHFKPVRFSQNFWIAAHHHKIEDKQATVLRLDPGLAFGTGHHPTTALCLEWLAAHPPKGLSVCDYGCGSGILAIAAALLHAKNVYAIDIDPQALQATRNNAENNKVADKIQLLDVKSPLPEVELLIANILLNPLIQLADKLSKHCKRILLSGILCAQTEELRLAYRPHYDLQTVAIKDDWALMYAEKK